MQSKQKYGKATAQVVREAFFENVVLGQHELLIGFRHQESMLSPRALSPTLPGLTRLQLSWTGLGPVLLQAWRTRTVCLSYLPYATSPPGYRKTKPDVLDFTHHSSSVVLTLDRLVWLLLLMLSVVMGSIKAGVCYAGALAKDKLNKALWSYTMLHNQYCYYEW